MTPITYEKAMPMLREMFWSGEAPVRLEWFRFWMRQMLAWAQITTPITVRAWEDCA